MHVEKKKETVNSSDLEKKETKKVLQIKVTEEKER